ncbi:hypothetical protein KEJ39_07735, partial [Candidatus Bathyarchaeota archaeon]|nr:hypothetical protein [Candidatus Bathyarchaeota archaeon]
MFLQCRSAGERQKWGIAFGPSPKPQDSKSSTVNLKEIPYTDQPIDIFTRLEGCSDYAYLLESAEGPERLARFTFIGFAPQSVISVKDHVARITNPSGEEYRETISPLGILRDKVQRNPLPLNRFRLAGGAVGYISYDAVRYWEDIPESAEDDLGFPDLEMAVFDDGIVFDHTDRSAYYYFQGRNRLAEIRGAVQDV